MSEEMRGMFRSKSLAEGRNSLGRFADHASQYIYLSN